MPEKKKTVAKKKVSKKSTQKKGLKKVPSEVSFYIVNGTVCSDLLELAEALEGLAEDHFKHHVNEMKNDFANWVEHIIEEPQLANKLREAETKEKHVIILLKHVLKQV
ncbi:MAG: hypothetical protein ABH828_06210 [archaeon]